MDIREKLTELLFSAPVKGNEVGLLDCGVIADYLIDHGVMIQEWIPVSKPPKENGEYWVAHKQVDEYFYNTAIYDGVYFRFKLVGSIIPNVTHWMLLPQLPKGE